METEIEKLQAREAELTKKCEELGKERLEINAEISRLKKGERRFQLVRRLASNPGDQNGYLWFDKYKKNFVYSDHSADGEHGKVGLPTQTDDGVLWLTGQSWIEAHSWDGVSEPSISLRFDVTSERDEASYKIMVGYAAGMEIIEICQFPLPHTHDQTPMARALGLLVNSRHEMIKARQRLPEAVRETLRKLSLPVRELTCFCDPDSATDTCVLPGCKTKQPAEKRPCICASESASSSCGSCMVPYKPPCTCQPGGLNQSCSGCLPVKK